MSLRKLLLYTRADCPLCDEMKSTIRQISSKVSLELEKVDVDATPELRARFGFEVPVLFIDGRKAFKYRWTGKQLERRLRRGDLWRRLGIGK